MNKIKVFEKELSWITNSNIREFAEVAISRLPDYFFTVAASSTGKYHPAYALGNGGLVRHTKAAVKIANELLGIETFGKYSSEEKDLIITALILHDGWKHGENYSKYTVAEHPVVAADFVKKVNKDEKILANEQAERLAELIISHMGQWNTDRYKNEIMPKPNKSIQHFVHLCDYLASRKYLIFDFGDEFYLPENY
ncbi:MAG: HD domain-containing protein [Lachnospiraceae bacterium]|nr:HD domain-containing protein [Lachnospiraceae bacterium]